MEGDGSISQCHTALNLRSQPEIFEEVVSTVELFMTIVHPSDFSRARRSALSSWRRPRLMRTCFWNFPLQLLLRKLVRKNFRPQNYSNFRNRKTNCFHFETSLSPAPKKVVKTVWQWQLRL